MHEAIDYVELPGGEMERTKAFYGAAFGWTFQDFGPEYAAFADAGLDWGLSGATPPGTPPLVIMRSDDVDATLAAVVAGGGEPPAVFEFPGR